ncbi:hypothetical protein Fot_28861 [Forsythia ovata]|uniref:Uncharacterized protein n=1 Tax=Forsythia ovata TaxID=205694 RepID=A0ABD1TQ73_9LAMI
MASVPGVAIPHAPETMVSSSSFISSALEVISGVPSVLFSAGPASLLENFGRPDKRNAVTDSKEEQFVLGKGMEDVGDFQRTGRGREDPPSDRTKDLREQLTFSENARARAIYDITKVKTIQRVCVQAQKKAESQLRSCQNMVNAKDKELTEALTKLSKAQCLLAKLGVPGYVDPKGPTGT